MLNNEGLLWHLPSGTERKQGKNSLRIFTVPDKIETEYFLSTVLNDERNQIFCSVFMTSLMKSIRILSMAIYADY